MIIINSTTTINNKENSSAQIGKNFDFMTSESYYAGSDENYDSVFLGKRNGNRVFLVNRPKKSLSVFVTVFRGKIINDNGKCFIKGYFGKRYFDYFLFLILTVVFLLFAREMNSTYYSGSIMAAVFWGGIILLFLFPSKKTKSKYIDFLQRVLDSSIE